MSNFFGTNWPPGTWHVPEDDLLPFVDGELPVKEAAKVRNHLEACWSCRQRIEKVQKTISAFVEYYNSGYVVGLDPAPGEWRTFDPKLKSVIAEADRESVLRGWLLPRIAPLPSLHTMARLAVGLSVAALVMVVTFVLYRTPRVSASQLIQKASEERTLRLSVVAHPVVYQKLRVQAGSQPAAPVTWEIWNDEESGNAKQRVEDSAGLRFIPPERDSATGHASQARESRALGTVGALHSQSSLGSVDRSVPPILRELQQVFQANHMDWRRPLALASYTSWTRSIGHVSEEVRETQLPSGEQAYVLIATAAGPFELHALAKTELTIRSRDWHPLQQRLEFREGNSIESLDLAELAFSVTSPAIATLPLLADKRPLAPLLEGLPVLESPPAAPTEIELLEAETQADYALHRLGACTGEPIEVRREPAGQVIVQGLAETPERKAQLEEILRPIPLVAVNIQSSEDVSPPNAAPDGSLSEAEQAEEPPQPGVEAIQRIPASKSPMEDQLRKYFTRLSAGDLGHARVESEPAAVDEEITALSNEAVSLSEAALMEAWALRRLAEAYSLKVDQLSPRGRRLLEIMLTEHLAALKLHTDRSRVLLRPVLSSLGSATPPLAEGAEDKVARSLAVSDSSWSDAVLRLWTTAQQMERLTAYLFAGASCPEAKESAAQNLLDALNTIDMESRETQAGVAAGFSGHSDLTGNRESAAGGVRR